MAKPITPAEAQEREVNVWRALGQEDANRLPSPTKRVAIRQNESHRNVVQYILLVAALAVTTIGYVAAMEILDSNKENNALCNPTPPAGQENRTTSSQK